MAARQHPKEAQMRQRLAQEAARIMVESGQRDFQQAKRKAAQRLGAPDTRNLPSNAEIDEALRLHQRLFQAELQPSVLRDLREAALKAMGLLQDFNPRLVGEVLEGTADQYSSVELHLFAEPVEEVQWFLHDHHIPFNSQTRRLRYDREQYQTHSQYDFMAGTHRITLTVFPMTGLRQAPVSPVDGRPMQRANLKRVQELLEEDLPQYDGAGG